MGSDIDIAGLSEKSFQGDKKIVEICEKIVYNKNGKEGFTLNIVEPSGRKSINESCAVEKYV